MNAEIEQLVSDAIDLTGADAPDLLAEDSPALAKPTSGDGEDFYLVGLIGGKDVGKSSFVNALVGGGAVSARDCRRDASCVLRTGRSDDHRRL